MNKEQIIDEAYSNYCYSCVREAKKQEQEMKERGGWLTLCLTPFFENKEQFLNLIKTDTEFSEKWGLKIEERELNRKERGDYYYKHGNIEGIVEGSLDRPMWENDETAHKWYDKRNVPTKLITLTYNNEAIESYE